MASRTVTRKDVTGTITEHARSKQGAPCKPDELKEMYPVTIYMTKSDYEKYTEAQKNSSMKKSAFGRLIIFFGLEDYLNQTIG